ncbi:hypothetical protein NWQ33_05885 [Mycoplasmopsis cynos]|nr:hypothetical protein [Mycoplasmopsis cynos]
MTNTIGSDSLVITLTILINTIFWSYFWISATTKSFSLVWTCLETITHVKFWYLESTGEKYIVLFLCLIKPWTSVLFLWITFVITPSELLDSLSWGFM